MSRVNVDELQMQSAVPSRGAGHILPNLESHLWDLTVRDDKACSFCRWPACMQCRNECIHTWHLSFGQYVTCCRASSLFFHLSRWWIRSRRFIHRVILSVCLVTTGQKVPTFTADYAASSEALKVFNQPQNVPQESFSCKPLFGAVYGELGWIW